MYLLGNVYKERYLEQFTMYQIIISEYSDRSSRLVVHLSVLCLTKRTKYIPIHDKYNWLGQNTELIEGNANPY